MHTSKQFTSLFYEDPQQYLRNFLEISDTYISSRVSSNYVRLIFFLFSLLRKQKRWLREEPPNSIITWNDLAWKFLIHFFLSRKTSKLKNGILCFRLKDGENLIKHGRGLNKCSGISHTTIRLMDFGAYIYRGTWSYTKIFLDLAVGEQALEKTHDELRTLLNRISQW